MFFIREILMLGPKHEKSTLFILYFSYFLRVNFGLKGLFLNIHVLLNETCHHQQEVYEDVFSSSLTCSWDSRNVVPNDFTPRSAQNKHWNKFHFKEILKLKTSCITGKYYSVAVI